MSKSKTSDVLVEDNHIVNMISPYYSGDAFLKGAEEFSVELNISAALKNRVANLYDIDIDAITHERKYCLFHIVKSEIQPLFASPSSCKITLAEADVDPARPRIVQFADNFF